MKAVGQGPPVVHTPVHDDISVSRNAALIQLETEDCELCTV